MRAVIGAFAFLSIFTFFKIPLFPANEIVPIYVFPALLLLLWRGRNVQGSQAILLSSLLCIAFASFTVSSHSASGTDALQLLVIAIALISYNALSVLQRDHFHYVLRAVIYVVTLIIIAEKLFPPVVDFVYQHLTNRSGSAEHLLSYSGGVPGIAPEPAYMASFLIGAYVLHRAHVPRRHLLFEICLLGSVALTASLTGIFFAIAVVFIFTSTIKEAAALVIVALGGASFFMAQNPLIAARLEHFLDLISQGSISLSTLAALDEMYGSARFYSLIEPLSNLCCGTLFGAEYKKSYSPYSVSFYLAAPFHLIALPFLLRRSRASVASVFLFIFAGPVLNWMCLAGSLGFVRASRKRQAASRIILERLTARRLVRDQYDALAAKYTSNNLPQDCSNRDL